MWQEIKSNTPCKRWKKQGGNQDQQISSTFLNSIIVEFETWALETLIFFVCFFTFLFSTVFFFFYPLLTEGFVCFINLWEKNSVIPRDCYTG